MISIGKSLVFIGFLISLLGVIIIIFSRLKISFLGNLPGDIFIRKKNFVFYFPIATSIILSGIISLIFYLFSRKQ